MHELSIYAHFTSKEELDRAIRQHLNDQWKAINKTDRLVLELIAKYSAEHLAAQMTHKVMEEELGVSNTTIRRTLRKLEKLKMIERIPYVKPTLNGLGPNIYVVLPVEDGVI
ncbi:helix-turn-helix domain-containing protein [Sporosarcina sp. GW1-11]|uniref:helix-turn-helix domain-containing protein n=1 Tax=Sporosarcina sp. GW1-11 TaxID=2899126 RepID=UPI00294EB641|nr:helix-turn-helix domain-containing protein [Sporosarcina sp. GW1-11]MDV6379250.1 helix-turn-helix domain-containing protein [Sporosarcina sp. GW1-11]